MQLQDYARVLFKRWWIIILLAAYRPPVSAYAFSKLQTPIYKSTVTLSAVPSRPSDYGQSLAIKNLLAQLCSANAIARAHATRHRQIATRRVERQVRKPDQFQRGRIDVDDFEIEARHPRPAKPRRRWRKHSPRHSSRQHNQENLQIDQRDRILVTILHNATSPDIFSPKTSINVLAGGGDGLTHRLVDHFRFGMARIGHRAHRRRCRAFDWRHGAGFDS